MVFCMGDTKSLRAVSYLLNEYAFNSGQICNNAKSLIYAGGVSLDRHKYLTNIIGFVRTTPPMV